MRLEYRILERTICQGEVPLPPVKSAQSIRTRYFRSGLSLGWSGLLERAFAGGAGMGGVLR